MSHHDPDRAARLAKLTEVGALLVELFAYANGLPEADRVRARAHLRDIFSGAAGTPGQSTSKAATSTAAAPSSGTRTSTPGYAPRPATANSGMPLGHAGAGMGLGPPRPTGGPPCKRCDGTGMWKGEKTSAPCFGCGGSGVARARRAG